MERAPHADGLDSRDVDRSVLSVMTMNSNPTSVAPADPVSVKKLLHPSSI
jgi:hypothetical protein